MISNISSFILDDYLGQVIVPLSTVNRDQTCRLILPVLPRSSKSEHSRGDISLEVRNLPKLWDGNDSSITLNIGWVLVCLSKCI